MDADSWKKREERYSKKFQAGKKYIPKLFEGFNIPEHHEIEQIALLGFASKANHQTLVGGKIVLVSELLEEIILELIPKNVSSEAVPEQFPILRTMQFVVDNRNVLLDALQS